MSLDHEKSSGYVGTEKGRSADDGASYVDGPADIFTEGALDPIYQAKARILNEALQEIGMGKYQVRYPFYLCLHNLTAGHQWFLFVVAGFGWFA